MVTRLMLIMAAILLVSSCASIKASRNKYTPVQYFKNYALCTCIADGFNSDDVVKDAAAGARGYLEFGDLPLEAHTEATLLGRKFLEKKYNSKTGEKLIIMKCIDFYNSKELDELAKKFENAQ